MACCVVKHAPAVSFCHECDARGYVARACRPLQFALGRVAMDVAWIDVVECVGYVYFLALGVDGDAVWRLYGLFCPVGDEHVSY